MVMNYAEMGNLQNFLNVKRRSIYKKYKWHQQNVDFGLKMWKTKLGILLDISSGLHRIHGKKLVHRDLHIGNIVCNKNTPCITDLGLCKPANYNELKNSEHNMYGVTSYLAPEILRGGNYTQASDIYSFGIIIYVVISELRPYYNIAHDGFLALNICEGLRPEFNIKVPSLILHLIKRCLDADPLNRPTSTEISRTLDGWVNELKIHIENIQEESIKTELIKQIEEAEKINNLSSSNDSYLTHPEAIYKSRPFKYNNLPEPKNSDDYYKMYENISSKKYSGIKLT
jgi:serine/threonine protein kinase